ncbi:MAG: FKBP-type peptidyl-prolyl cis-trans isomerase [Kofleriaceae bacterium]|jgi:FKBP-type peptidyl-prolyl cis-trans isomerase|nr:FKBP-type peptidyl-prolyl cis-trans isomerase [Kofleriaceae bacterium]
MRAPALASLLLLLLTACGSKAATTTTPVPPDDPAGAGSGSSGATAAAACGPAVAALMGPVNKQLRDGLPPELVDVWVPRFLAVMTTSCQEDGWSAEGVRCLTEAKGDPEIEACNAKLDTPELAKQLEARMKPLLQEFAAAVQQAMLRKTVAQVPAPFPAKAPPADLVATSSGLRYRKGAAAPATEAAIGGNDTIVADVTEWNLAGDTVANEHGGRYQLPQQSAGMAEAMGLLRKGERAVFVIPAALDVPPGGKAASGPRPGADVRLVEIGVTEVVRAPATPPATPTKAAKALASGQRYLSLVAGRGRGPAPIDAVSWRMSAWDGRGRMFISNETGDDAHLVDVSAMPPYLGNLLRTMKAGGRARVWIDSKDHPGWDELVGPGPITVEVTLAKVHVMPPAPADLAPPASAKKTSGGVSYVVLRRGKGKVHPSDSAQVEVHYTGWTTDGKRFDTSALRDKPQRMTLDSLIPGWREGVQAMVVGDKVRMWIPEALAYAGEEGAPAGMLVFEVELLGFDEPRADAPVPAPVE